MAQPERTKAEFCDSLFAMLKGKSTYNFVPTSNLVHDAIAWIEALHLKKMEPAPLDSPIPENFALSNSLFTGPDRRHVGEKEFPMNPKEAGNRDGTLYLNGYLTALGAAQQPDRIVIVFSLWERPIRIVRKIILGRAGLDEFEVHRGLLTKRHFASMTESSSRIARSQLRFPDFEIQNLWKVTPKLCDLIHPERENTFYLIAPSRHVTGELEDRCRYLSDQLQIPVVLFAEDARFSQ